MKMSRWILTLLFFPLAGCAMLPKQDLGEPVHKRQIEELQGELVEKEERIHELEDTLHEYRVRDAMKPAPRVGIAPAAKNSPVIHIKNLTPLELQKALKAAGFDPGPADGKIGKKTLDALRGFQASRGLEPDGIVGEKTWAALKASS